MGKGPLYLSPKIIFHLMNDCLVSLSLNNTVNLFSQTKQVDLQFVRSCTDTIFQTVDSLVSCGHVIGYKWIDHEGLDIIQLLA